MSIQVTMHPGAYLRVVGTGTASLPDLIALLDRIAEATRSQGQRRVLLDLLEVEPQLSFTDHLTAGAHAAQALSHVERVASVVPIRFRTGSSEKAAQKSGLDLRTFTEMAEAMRWIDEDGGRA